MCHLPFSRCAGVAIDQATSWPGHRKAVSGCMSFVRGSLTRPVRGTRLAAEGKPDHYPALAAELVSLGVDVIVATHVETAMAAKLGEGRGDRCWRALMLPTIRARGKGATRWT